MLQNQRHKAQMISVTRNKCFEPDDLVIVTFPPVEGIVKTSPQVAILDIQMPGYSGLEVTREITKKGLKTRVLILAVHESDSLVREVIEAGARGYILKSDAARD